jgi:diguanylate cyclase (GGDEF)-like protein
MTLEKVKKKSNQKRSKAPSHLSARIIDDIIKSLLISLHSDEILEQFTYTLKKHLRFSNLRFVDEHKNIKFNYGRKTKFELSYNLSDESPAQLGTIIFGREQEFDEQELSLIEELLSFLVLSLKNAKMHQQALEQAEIDPLTQLLNRHSLDTRLKREMELARRNHQSLSILMADLDNFKKINDQHGHPVGDEILKHASQLLKESARGIDLIFRIGGEEFLIILSNTTPKGALNLAKRIVKKVEQTDFKVRKKNIPCTISIGIAHLTKEDSESSLLVRVDKALYKAKHQGRNQVVDDHSLLPEPIKIKNS